jgi:hypothetical protein
MAEMKVNTIVEAKRIITSKYNMFPRRHIRGSNVVMDDYYLNEVLYSEDVQKRTTFSCISPMIAKRMNLDAIHISELCAMLGYSRRDVKKLLLGVKAKKEKLALLGAGGSGSNFIFFLDEMIKWTNTINVFDELRIYDADDFEFHNLPRIPFDLDDLKNLVSA